MINKLIEEKSLMYYWLVMALFALTLELTALFYQYVLDYGPCVLCIHVRVYLLGLLIISIIGVAVKQSVKAQVATHLLSLILFSGLLERSYQLLGTERGFVFSECNMESGLPSWLALDQWFPLVFKIHEACGYTPVLLFGVTMAEALIVLSVVLFLLSVLMLFLLVKRAWYDR